MHGKSISYDDPAGTAMNISVATSSTMAGASFNISGQSTSYSGAAGGALVFKTGASTTDKSGGLTLKLGNYNTEASISIAEASTGARVIGLCLEQSAIDSTLMPAGTGDNVIYIGNATSDPTTGIPVDGAILYGSAGKLKVKQSDGYTVTIGEGFTSETSLFSLADPGGGGSVTFDIASVATNSAGDFNFYAQDTTFAGGTGGNVKIKAGDSATGLGGSIKLGSGNDSNYAIMISETTAGVSNLGLVVNSATFTSAHLPANSGDGVIYIGNAATAPTSGSPIGGLVLYGSQGELYIKKPTGDVTQLGGMITVTDTADLADYSAYLAQGSLAYVTTTRSILGLYS